MPAAAMGGIVKVRSVTVRSASVRRVAARNVTVRSATGRVAALALSVCVAASTIVVAPRVARAADSAKSERAEARRLVLEGDGFYEQQSYAQALERYVQAYGIVHVPTVGIEVVKAQKALGKLVEAAQTAREVSALPQAPGEPAVFDQARLQAARDVLALSERTPTLLLDVAPRGVLFMVQIDGVSPAGQAPFSLNPGVRHVRVSAEGYQTVELDVPLQEAERQTLSVSLIANDTAGKAVSGAGATPAGAARVSPVAVPPPPVEAAQGGSSKRTLGWVGIGVAGVGVAAGTIAGISAFSTKPDCPNDVCSPSQRDDIQTSKTLGYIADVGFGVAIVAGALGIWALVTSSPGNEPESAALPALAPRADAEGSSAEKRGLAVTSIDFGTGPVQLSVSGSF